MQRLFIAFIFILPQLSLAGIYQGACSLGGHIIENVATTFGADGCQNDTFNEYQTLACGLDSNGFVYTYTGVNSESRRDFNEITDTIALQGTAMSVYKMNQCQVDFFELYSTNQERQDDFLLNANNTYSAVATEIKRVRSEMEQVRSYHLSRIPTNASETAFERALQRIEQQNARNEAIQNKLIESIPMGNRPLMRNLIIQSAMDQTPAEQFTSQFSAKMTVLKEQAQSSFDNIHSKIAYSNSQNIPEENYVFNIDDGLRGQLLESGMVHNYITENNLAEFAQSGYLCRIDRDARGCLAVDAALAAGSFIVPHIAIASAAFRTAVAANRVRTIAAAANLTRSAAAGIASTTLFGVEALLLTEDIRNSCFTDEFMASTQNSECDAEKQYYEIVAHANTAGCIASGLIGGTFLASTTLAGARRLIRASDSGEESGIINVIGRRTRDLANRTRSRFRPGELSENAQARITSNLDIINSRQFGAVPNVEATILRYVDPQLRPGFERAVEALNDKQQISNYMETLQRDTFEAMRSSREPSLIRMFEAGELDRNTMLSVLMRRAQSKNIDVVTINQTLARKDFNAEIGRGYIIDRGFVEGADDGHGTYTHLIQQDFAYEIIQRESGRPYSEIINFFGTENGINVWDSMFDAFTDNPMSPEYFNRNLMNNLIPLGYKYSIVDLKSLVA